MKRREFCRQLALVSGAVVLAPLVKGCAPEGDTEAVSQRLVRPTGLPTETGTATMPPTLTRPPFLASTPDVESTPTSERPTEEPTTETAQPTATAEAGVAMVALVKTGDRAYGVRRAIELLDFNPVRGNRVLLKPNYNSADAAPASTHQDIMRALVTELYELGARSITAGERSGMGDTRTVLAQRGVFSLGEELGFETVVFDELAEEAWTVVDSADFHWQSGFAVPKLLLDSECVVQTCNIKTHRYGGHFTMSLKNSVGLVAKTTGTGGRNYMSELHDSVYQRELVAEINTVYQPALIIADGVEAFVDGGPARGKLVSPSVVLAGTDRVAIDAVGVAILRMLGTTPQVSEGRVFEQAQIARAVELGLGVEAAERIRLVTGDAESAAYAEAIRGYLF